MWFIPDQVVDSARSGLIKSPLQPREKMKAYRERIRSDPVKYQQQKEKDKERKKLARGREKEEVESLSCRKKRIFNWREE